MLICCDGDKRWRAKADDGARIEWLSGAANGDDGDRQGDKGEYWKITTVDGTQYWFGSLPDAQSTWTIPVFGDDPGEQCNRGSFDASHCNQAWRWNLDKVVDPNGNVIRYFYETESNKYGMNMRDTAVSYIRGGILHHIDYGINENVDAVASGRVEFNPADRCVPGSECTLDRKRQLAGHRAGQQVRHCYLRQPLAGRFTSSRDAGGNTLAFVHDALARKTATHKDTVDGPVLARWIYDTATSGVGLPATSTRFVGQQRHEYTATVNSYAALNAPLQTSVTIPAVEGLLAGTYTTNLGYGADGPLTDESYPAVGDPVAGGLGAETVNYGRDNWGRPTNTRTGADVKLVANTLHTRYGEVERVEHGGVGTRAWQSFYYDTSTWRLIRSIVDAEVPKPMQADTRYIYDPIGNIISVDDLTLGQPVPDVQCFRYDHVRRLTEASTAAGTDWDEGKGGCTAEPAVGASPAPYWLSYRYEPGGNRAEETQRTTSTTTKRTYGFPGTGQLHTLRTISGGSRST